MALNSDKKFVLIIYTIYDKCAYEIIQRGLDNKLKIIIRVALMFYYYCTSIFLLITCPIVFIINNSFKSSMHAYY